MSKEPCRTCPTCSRSFGTEIVPQPPKFCCWCARPMDTRHEATERGGDMCGPCTRLSGDENREPDGTYRHFCSQTAAPLPNFRPGR